MIQKFNFYCYNSSPVSPLQISSILEKLCRCYQMFIFDSIFSSEFYSQILSCVWREEVKWSEVAQLCPTLWDPMDCSPPDSSIHEILQARLLEWVAISFSRGSSRPRDWTRVSCIVGRCFTICATREAQASREACVA